MDWYWYVIAFFLSFIAAFVILRLVVPRNRGDIQKKPEREYQRKTERKEVVPDDDGICHGHPLMQFVAIAVPFIIVLIVGYTVMTNVTTQLNETMPASEQLNTSIQVLQTTTKFFPVIFVTVIGGLTIGGLTSIFSGTNFCTGETKTEEPRKKKRRIQSDDERTYSRRMHRGD